MDRKQHQQQHHPKNNKNYSLCKFWKEKMMIYDCDLLTLFYFIIQLILCCSVWYLFLIIALFLSLLYLKIFFFFLVLIQMKNWHEMSVCCCEYRSAKFYVRITVWIQPTSIPVKLLHRMRNITFYSYLLDFYEL